MSDEIIESQGDVSQESSVPTESAPEPSPSEQSAQTQTQEAVEQNVPYSRFKEVIEQRNQERAEFDKRLSEMQRNFDSRFQEFSKQYKQPEAAKPANKFVEDLKKIDPEYAKTLEEALSTKEQVAQLVAEQQRREKEQLINSFNNKVNSFVSDNKISDKLKPIYKAMAENMALANKPTSIDAVDDYLKQIHSVFSEHSEEIKRSERASYVEAKKKDASTPATQTGGSPAPMKGKEGPKSRQEVISQIAKEMRAANQKV